MAADIPYSVRRSTRARRVRVTVDPHAGVEVVLPQRAPAREADVAVAQLRGWIERRLAEAESVRSQVAARGDTVPYLGRDLRLVVEPGRTRVHRRGDTLLVPGADARRRRWSAGTAARPRPRSRRGWTRRSRGWGGPTRDWPSAPSAPAGARAPPTA